MRPPGRGVSVYGGDQLGAAHGRAGGGHQRAQVVLERLHARPLAVVVARRRPPGPLQAGIVRLTVIDVVGQDRARGGAPPLVRAHPLDSAILIHQFKLCQQGELIAVNVAAPPAKANPTPIPAIPQDGAYGIPPRLEQRRHIKGLIAQPMGIHGPAGVEEVIPHGGPV